MQTTIPTTATRTRTSNYEGSKPAQAALRTHAIMDDSISPDSLEGDHWLVQYCLYGPERGAMAVMPAADAIRQNIAEARKTVPRNYWVTVGLACSNNKAKEVRTKLRRELANGNQGNP